MPFGGHEAPSKFFLTSTSSFSTWAQCLFPSWQPMLTNILRIKAPLEAPMFTSSALLGFHIHILMLACPSKSKQQWGLSEP